MNKKCIMVWLFFTSSTGWLSAAQAQLLDALRLAELLQQFPVQAQQRFVPRAKSMSSLDLGPAASEQSVSDGSLGQQSSRGSSVALPPLVHEHDDIQQMFAEAAQRHEQAQQDAQEQRNRILENIRREQEGEDHLQQMQEEQERQHAGKAAYADPVPKDVDSNSTNVESPSVHSSLSDHSVGQEVRFYDAIVEADSMCPICTELLLPMGRDNWVAHRDHVICKPCWNNWVVRHAYNCPVCHEQNPVGQMDDN